MSQAIMNAWLNSKMVRSDQIWATNRSFGKLQRLQETLGIHVLKNNEELIDQCDIVVIGVKPQDLYTALEPIASSFTPTHTVISLAAGVSLASLKKLMPNAVQMIRIMPNTAASIQKAVVGYCLSEGAKPLKSFVEQLFEPLGLVVAVEEGDEFEALTVSCSSGIGFVYELMLYWQEWLEEHGFSPETAKAMTIQTFLGASMLANINDKMSIQDLQTKVVSKKGVTAAGLDSMQELELERALRYSFEKAVLRDRELGKM